MPAGPHTMMVGVVAPGKAAEAAGLMPGDYLMVIDGTEVTSLAKADGAKLLRLVARATPCWLDTAERCGR